MIQKPMMNPNAESDFAKAIKEAGEKLCHDLGEQMQKNAEEGVMSFLGFDDMPTTYSGIMRLSTSALWESLVDTLTDNGYEVTVRKEDATETERELDKVDEWIVIEYEEVE